MADKNKEDVIEVKEPVRAKLNGKIMFIAKGMISVKYIEKGVAYGTMVEYDGRLHSKLGVGDDIQISI